MSILDGPINSQEVYTRACLYPTRTVSAGKMNLGTFRTYKPLEKDLLSTRPHLIKEKALVYTASNMS